MTAATALASADSAGCSEYSLNLEFTGGRSYLGNHKPADSLSAEMIAYPQAIEGGNLMVRRIFLAASCAGALACCLAQADSAQAQQAYGRSWGQTYSTQDWQRFYHYPYVYYPQNFYGNEYYRSADSLYYRYPPEMRIPVYNRKWHNYYPNRRLYHSGHHFALDVF